MIYEPFGYEEAHEAAEFIRKQIAAKGLALPKISLTLGSGLKSYADLNTKPETRLEIPYESIPHFAKPKSHALGHQGALIIAPIEDGSNETLAIWSGRLHYYQSLLSHNGERITNIEDKKAAVVFYLAICRALDLNIILTSNAVGSVRPEQHRVGDLVAITDHILSPNEDFALPSDERWFDDVKAARPDYNYKAEDYFYGQNHLYSQHIHEKAHTLAQEQGLRLHEGILFWQKGRGYESPAMSRDIQIRGADLAGMSTAPEAQKARSLGYKNDGKRHFASFSLVTNVAVLHHDDQLTHDHVANAAQSTEKNVVPFMKSLILALG